MSNGRYVEYFTNDTLRRIGSVMFNTITNKIEYFIPQDDITYRTELDRAKEASRFMSVDPSASKYPWLSPYSGMGNNPILVVDPDGGDNVVYLLVLPSANTTLTKQNIADIVKQTNESYKAMGLKTEVRLADPAKFDISKIEKTDAVAVLGNRDAVVSYVGNNLKDKAFQDNLNGVSDNKWEGGADNPERSKNTKSGGSDNIIAIDASGLKGFASEVGLNDEKSPIIKSGALVLIHGSGHNSGLSHAYDNTQTTTSDIMRSANDMRTLLTNPASAYPTFQDVANNKDGHNNDFVKAVKARFGNNAPSEKNKQSIKQ